MRKVTPLRAIARRTNVRYHRDRSNDVSNSVPQVSINSYDSRKANYNLMTITSEQGLIGL